MVTTKNKTVGKLVHQINTQKLPMTCSLKLFGDKRLHNVDSYAS